MLHSVLQNWMEIIELERNNVNDQIKNDLFVAHGFKSKYSSSCKWFWQGRFEVSGVCCLWILTCPVADWLWLRCWNTYRTVLLHVLTRVTSVPCRPGNHSFTIYRGHIVWQLWKYLIKLCSIWKIFEEELFDLTGTTTFLHWFLKISFIYQDFAMLLGKQENKLKTFTKTKCKLTFRLLCK